MPFDAMKGLQESLRDREERHSRVDRHEISEEQAAENSAAVQRIRKGSLVRLSLYLDFHDTELTGTVTGISLPTRWLSLDGQKILFEDIYTVTILDP